jgi:hypothetical protein
MKNAMMMFGSTKAMLLNGFTTTMKRESVITYYVWSGCGNRKSYFHAVDLRDTSASAYRLRPGVIGALNTRIISV